MSLKPIRDAFYDELKSIKSSPYKLFITTFLPLVCFLLIMGVFYRGVLDNIPIVVVDKDKTKFSRSIIKALDDTKALSVDFKVESLDEALRLVKKTKAYSVVIISKHFQKDTINHNPPTITAMTNTQYILIGKMINATLSTTIMSSAGIIGFVQNMAMQKTPIQSLAAVMPIKIEITPLFNTTQNYFIFLTSALLPAIWQIFIVIATIVSFGVMRKNSTCKEYLREHTAQKMTGMMLPYTFFYTILGTMMVAFLYGMLGWEFQGSFGVVVLGIFLTTVAYQSVGAFLFSIEFDYAKALSLGAVYSAPAFAFLGVTFPIYSMNDFALFWRSLLPISHYMELQISQANYGAYIFDDIDKLLSIFAFWIFFAFAVVIFRYRVAR